jgi:hypothetical protein
MESGNEFPHSRFAGKGRSVKYLHIAIWLVGMAPASLMAALPRPATEKPLWLAVARAELAPALEPLAEKRRQDGFEAVVSTKPIAESLAALRRRPAFLLLVGDDEPGQEQAAWYLAAQRKKLYRWRAEQALEYASDMAWGDPGNGSPDLPVGRIPARNREQAALVVKKIIAFESQPPAAADLQLPVWFGSPEYTETINALASGLGVQMLQNHGPAWLRPWIVSGNPRDPFCGWPPEQASLFSRQLRGGGIAGVLMGHASEDAFFSMRFQGRPIWYDAGGSAEEFGATGTSRAPGTPVPGRPVPPLIFFTCSTGNFVRAAPCQAKALLFCPGGPVAVIGATTESHPLTNYFSGLCLLQALGGKENRLGRIWLESQKAAQRRHDFVIEAMLRDAEGKLDKQIDEAKLRHDQLFMYAILGDPATRLRLPRSLQATMQQTATGWRWQATRPPEATRLEVGLRKAPAYSMSATPVRTQAAPARKAFDAANAAFDFTTVATLGQDVPWEGTIGRDPEYRVPRHLRLVASGGGRLYVAVLKLEGQQR